MAAESIAHKTCPRCGQPSHLTPSKIKRGSYTCLPCQRVEVQQWRESHRAHVRAYRDEWRAKNRPHVVAYQKNKDMAAHHAKYKRNHPDRIKARSAVWNALQAGKMEKLPCQSCGTTEKVHAHHHDYGKPLEVEWLCQKCHGLAHRRTI